MEKEIHCHMLDGMMFSMWIVHYLAKQHGCHHPPLSGGRQWAFFVCIDFYFLFRNFTYDCPAWWRICFFMSRWSQECFVSAVYTRTWPCGGMCLQIYAWMVAVLPHQKYLPSRGVVHLRNIWIKSMCAFIIANWGPCFGRITSPLKICLVKFVFCFVLFIC